MAWAPCVRTAQMVKNLFPTFRALEARSHSVGRVATAGGACRPVSVANLQRGCGLHPTALATHYRRTLVALSLPVQQEGYSSSSPQESQSSQPQAGHASTQQLTAAFLSAEPHPAALPSLAVTTESQGSSFEAALSSSAEIAPKRRRGHAPASKDPIDATPVPVLDAETDSAAASASETVAGNEPKRRGRKPGSGRKSLSSAEPTAEPEAPAETRPKRTRKGKAVAADTEGQEASQSTPVETLLSEGSAASNPTPRKRGRAAKTTAGAPGRAETDVQAATAAAAPAKSKGRGASSKPPKEPSMPKPTVQDLQYLPLPFLTRTALSLYGHIDPSRKQPKDDDDASFRYITEVLEYKGAVDNKASVGTITTDALVLMYQGYLARGEFMDLFALDFDGTVSVEHLQPALGNLSRPTAGPTDKNKEEMLAWLQQHVGQQVEYTRERVHKRMVEFQVEMVLQDIVSQTAAGDPSHPDFVQRRCAALLLDGGTIGRLAAYQHDPSLSALQLAAVGGGAKPVKPLTALDSVIEGVKAGVDLPHDRLVTDFLLGAALPSDPCPHHLHYVEVRDAVAARAESWKDKAGESASLHIFYDDVYKLLRKQDAKGALSAEGLQRLEAQEEWWASTGGVPAASTTSTTSTKAKRAPKPPDRSEITSAQIRLVYHLERLAKEAGAWRDLLEACRAREAAVLMQQQQQQQ